MHRFPFSPTSNNAHAFPSSPPPPQPNRFNTPKYRLVVRFTSKDISCQIVSSTLAGDVVMVSAYAHELPRYGLKVGLTNYSAAYATGLLIARRALGKLGLAEAYAGLEEASGEDYTVEPADGAPRPFAVLLDTGLKRTSTGSRVFGALKGALDGGLDIPHGDKRFVGYDADSKVGSNCPFSPISPSSGAKSGAKKLLLIPLLAERTAERTAERRSCF